MWTVLLATIVLAIVPTVAAAQEATEDRVHAKEEAALLDCQDFATQRAAQAIFKMTSEDRFGLDQNGDGTACETQGDGVAEDGTRLGAEIGGDRGCMDFPSQKAAQDYLRANPADPYELDPETNGIACEIRPAAYENSATDLTPVAEAQSDADLDCEDFEYQQEAQMILFRDERDPNGLDGDGNGLACDDLPVLMSNAEEVGASILASDSEEAQAASLAPALLIQANQLSSRYDLVFKFVAAFLIGSGILVLLAVWRLRGSSGSE